LLNFIGKYKMKYKAELDGLRAISVFAVIIYHASFTIFNKDLLSGGFLGVDIFFVISGYLITSIILEEIYKKNKFFFTKFYERRVRRIAPVLFFTMLCSLPFAYTILSTTAIVDFSKSIISSIFIVSNIYFLYENNLYMEENVLLKPFLHTWSLSVEEQFYILFPIFIIIIIKFFKKYLLTFLIIGFLISILLSQYLQINHTNFNFYNIFSRAFELLLGSLLSYFKLYNAAGIVRYKSIGIFNHIFPKLGISLIIFSFFFFDNADTKLFPSLYSLIPLSGVCLIILYSHKEEIVTQILSKKIFVFFGLISYSLYLFHFAIFAFSRELEIFNDNNKFLFIFLTIIVSIFSFYFIEQPFRNKKIISLKKLVIILIISILFLISFSFYIIKKDGIKTRLPKIFQQKLLESNIKFYQKENLPKVLLIGDSHSDSLSYNLNEKLKKEAFSLFRFDTRMYLKDFNYVNRETLKIDKEFIESNNKIDNFLQENSNLIIVFHQRWTLKILETYFNNEEGFKEYKREINKYYDYLEPINIKTQFQKQREEFIKERLISQINQIINQGHKLILIYPVPEMGFDVRKLLYSKDLKKFIFNKEKYSPSIVSGSYEVYKNRNRLTFEILDSVQSTNIYRVYPHTHFCDKQIKNRCVGNDKENIFYYDDDHLSLQGSTFIVTDIMNIIKKINK